MVNYVPQATGLGEDGSPNAALVQALAARKKAQEMTPGQRLTAQASSSEPIYSKGLGYAKLAAGALGGWMQGQEARKQEDSARAGASNFQKLAIQYGATPEQAAGLAGLYMQNPAGASAIIKDLIENRTKPAQTQWVKTGTDLLGNDKYGAFDPRTGAVAGQGGGGGMPRPNAATGPAPAVAATAGGAIPAPAPAPSTAQPPAATAADPRRAEFTRGGYPENAPLPPPGANPKTFYDEWSKSQAASVLPAGADATAKVRGEIQQLPSYKNLSQAAPIYTAMFDAASKNTKASDLNLVYGLGKIMDPGSVVREGEMLMVKNTSGLTEGIMGAINALNGGAALTPDTRIALMREAKGRLDAYKQSFEQDMQQYQGIAEKNRMDPTQVIPQFPGAVEFDRAGPPIPPEILQQSQNPTPEPVPAPPDMSPYEAEARRRGLIP